MSVVRARIAVGFMCAAIGSMSPFAANASLLKQAVDFSVTNVSLWGSGGGGLGFRKNGSAGPFNYDFGASAGTLSARFSGEATVDYRSKVEGIGDTNISVRFGGPGLFEMSSDLGASGKLGLNLGGLGTWGLIDVGLRLQPSMGLTTPQIGSTYATPEAEVDLKTGLNAVIARAGGRIYIQERDSFSAKSLEGMLGYTLTGTDQIFFTPFSLLSNGGVDLKVNLPKFGLWEFWIADLSLQNSFRTSFDLGAGLFFQTRGCGFLGLRWCRQSNVNLAEFDLYDPAAFSLPFAKAGRSDSFFINVVRPATEPPAFAVMVAGLFMIGLFRARASRLAARD